MNKDAIVESIEQGGVQNSKNQFYNEPFLLGLGGLFAAGLYLFVGRDFLISAEKYLGDIKHIADPVLLLMTIVSFSFLIIFMPRLNFFRRN